MYDQARLCKMFNLGKVVRRSKISYKILQVIFQDLACSHKYFIGWCGRVGSNPREAHKVFEDHFEYFSTTLSRVCIQHDELG